eukprot:bmy_20483T0
MGLKRPGYQHCKSDVIFQLDRGEELWIEGRGFFQSHSPGRESALKEMLATQHISRKDTSTVIPLPLPHSSPPLIPASHQHQLSHLCTGGDTTGAFTPLLVSQCAMTLAYHVDSIMDV